MNKEEIEYWRGEINSTIWGLHARMKFDDSSNFFEEIKALDNICDLALETLKNGNDTDT